jgi:uncharacterized protein YuzE
MTWVHDRKANAASLLLSAARVVESEEVRPDLVLDFDARGHIVRIEVLDARAMLPPEALVSAQAA